jgi:uncharacterized RDD family membrane protein YckC
VRSQLRIRTPEGILFSYALAGPVTRCLAVSIDFIAALIIANFFARMIAVAGLIDQDFAQALTWIAYFVISIGYGVLFEWSWRGQTIGKKLFRLRVVDAGGLRLQFHQVLLRNLLRCIDMLPAFYMVGGVVSLFSSHAQRLGDLAAGTVVIHQPLQSEPDLDQLLAGKFNSLRDYPHLAARLRQRISPEEARLLLQALLRRDEFDADARLELFAEIAAHLKTLVTFPAEAIEAIPDEQYIRNVADIVFRHRLDETATNPRGALARPETPSDAIQSR